MLCYTVIVCCAVLVCGAGMFNVRQVLNAVAANTEPALGVVYKTDANSPAGANVEIIATAPSFVNNSIIYPVAPIENAANPGEANDFIEFLKDKGIEYFEELGFRSLLS